MTDRKCDGIDCAWCANPECPNEKNDMTDTEKLKNLQEQYNKLENIHNQTVRQYEALQKQYLVVVDLAKKNSDCYEYCLTSLEREVEELKKQKERKIL